MPPRAAAARKARARKPKERARYTLKSMGNQALRLASGRDTCAWSPTEVNAASEAIDTLGPKLTTALMNVIDEVSGDGISDAAPLEVCTALIKSHVLRAFCPLLAAAASPLLPGPQPQPQQPSRRSVQSALALAGQVRSVLGLMADTVKQGCTPEQRRGLTATLAKELAESGLLEHWARLVLGLGACEDGEDGAAQEAAQLGKHLEALSGYGSTYLRHHSRLDPWTELLLSDPCPCLAYLLSSHLVAFAAELDIGPNYGLPPAASEAQLSGPSSSSAQPPMPRPPVPLVDTAGFPLRPRKPGAAPVDGPWLHPASRPLRDGPPARLVDRADEITRQALSLAREALEPARVLADMPGQPIALYQLEKQLGAWWRAAVAWAAPRLEVGEDGRPGPRYALDWEFLKLLEVRGLRLSGDALDARLAMSAGFLQVVEAVLRYNNEHGQPPVGPDPWPFGCDLWGTAVLQAGPRQVASFVATMAKLLRKARLEAAAVMAQRPQSGGRAIAFPRALIKLATSGFMLVPPRSKSHVALAPAEVGDAPPGGAAGPSDGAAGPSHGPAAAASGGGSSAAEITPQLPLTAACVALQLLPEVAALAKDLAALPLGAVYAKSLPAKVDCGLHALLELLLAWVPPILLAAADPVPQAPAPETAASCAPAGPARSAAQHEWDRLLWDELDLAWVLSTAAKAVSSGPEAATARIFVRPLLAEALWALLARAPARLVAMVSAAEAAEEAAEGAGGAAAAAAPSVVGPTVGLLRRALHDGYADESTRRIVVKLAVLLLAPDRVNSVTGTRARFYRGATSLLASPAAAGLVLRRCSHPDCTHLAGPSEAAVQRQRCGGCMRARNCSQACQAAHWVAGHAHECRAAEPIDLSTA
ncbi:hypothetical protein HYH03_014595 [Edaphochlamys debaryana]|uniref:phytol kinase n=1 Tax=Edaphochlamys debaryana TaxID=47281 RepID=A0A835XMV1_9CHLO|nr:hypothetical protein HYH03_014595 [Edaphochlamys debaryana]|eukprot:KAG2486796.1 hypothetical protein HYH03_014595 [Edaphochlamys debaryana]